MLQPHVTNPINNERTETTQNASWINKPKTASYASTEHNENRHCKQWTVVGRQWSADHSPASTLPRSTSESLGGGRGGCVSGPGWRHSVTVMLGLVSGTSGRRMSHARGARAAGGGVGANGARRTSLRQLRRPRLVDAATNPPLNSPLHVPVQNLIPHVASMRIDTNGNVHYGMSIIKTIKKWRPIIEAEVIRYLLKSGELKS